MQAIPHACCHNADRDSISGVKQLLLRVPEEIIAGWSRVLLARGAA